MRVCIVASSPGTSGADRSLVEITSALISRRASCVVLLPDRGPMENELERLGAEYAVIPFRWWIDSRSWLGRLPKYIRTTASFPHVLRALRSWSVDLILTNTIGTPVGAVAARFLGKPHVWHIHEFGREDLGFSFDLGIRLSAKVMDRLSDAIIVNSRAVEEYYGRYIPRGKLKLIYPGPHSINAAAHHTPIFASDIPRLALVGRIAEPKGQAEAVEAVRRLASAGECVQLALVGSGEADYVARLKEISKNVGLEGLVLFAGQLEDPLQVIRDADAVLMCSRSEAFGSVTVEAMLMGKPVIGARSGATPELIRDGFNGLLYDPGEISDLVEKIRLLVEHPDLARQMGENGRRFAEQHFSIQKYTDQVLQVMQDQLTRGSRPGEASVSSFTSVTAVDKDRSNSTDSRP